jgi:hypothetical protein
MGTSDWVYRLKYKDANGTLSDREINIKALRRGDKSSNTYIHAFCHSANDVRTFRLDRVRALYLCNEKIKDLMKYLTERFEDAEPIPADTEALAAEALGDNNKKTEVPAAPVKISAKGFLLFLLLVAGVVCLFIELTLGLVLIFAFGIIALVMGIMGIKAKKKAVLEAEAEVNSPPEGQ